MADGQTLAERYKRMWGTELPQTLPPPEIPIGGAAPKRRPLNDRDLRLGWEDARTRVELIMHAANVALGEFVYHPQMEALEYLMVNHWDRLGQPAVLQEALRIIGRMQDNPPAQMLAYEELKIALGLGGEPWLPAQVAEEQQSFMNQSAFWQRFRSARNDHRPDYEPDVIDVEPTLAGD